MAGTIGLDIIAYQVVPIILGLIVKIGRRSYTPYIGVHFIVIGDSRYYIYADNPS